jgi:hypothetical protein
MRQFRRAEMPKQAEIRKQPAALAAALAGALAEDALVYFNPSAPVAKAERAGKLTPLDEMYAYYR